LSRFQPRNDVTALWSRQGKFVVKTSS